jgi:hypothetical protein
MFYPNSYSFGYLTYFPEITRYYVEVKFTKNGEKKTLYFEGNKVSDLQRVMNVNLEREGQPFRMKYNRSRGSFTQKVV